MRLDLNDGVVGIGKFNERTHIVVLEDISSSISSSVSSSTRVCQKKHDYTILETFPSFTTITHPFLLPPGLSQHVPAGWDPQQR